MTTFVEALIVELDAVPADVTHNLKIKYAEVLETVLKTALNEAKVRR